MAIKILISIIITTTIIFSSENAIDVLKKDYIFDKKQGLTEIDGIYIDTYYSMIFKTIEVEMEEKIQNSINRYLYTQKIIAMVNIHTFNQIDSLRHEYGFQNDTTFQNLYHDQSLKYLMNKII